MSALGGDDVRSKAKALWYLLTSACRGKAKNIVKQAEKFNGIVGWKHLTEEYHPQMAGRFNAMLMGLLRPDWTTGGNFLDLLSEWELQCQEHVAQSGQPLTDATQIAVVTQNCPPDVGWVVRMASMQGGDQYRNFKAQILLYLKQTERWSPGGGRDGCSPMDVGGIGFGKNGKGKRQPQAGQVCKICQKPGHSASDCWHRDGAPAKPPTGQGKGQEKDKGKGRDKDAAPKDAQKFSGN